jgi:RNA-binding protein YlmH
VTEGECGRGILRSAAGESQPEILPPTLSDIELDALRQIAAHPVKRHIPAHIRSRLMDIGYTKEVLGAIVLTDDGLQRIATGK